jgi:hypothetical protein
MTETKSGGVAQGGAHLVNDAPPLWVKGFVGQFYAAIRPIFHTIDIYQFNFKNAGTADFETLRGCWRNKIRKRTRALEERKKSNRILLSEHKEKNMTVQSKLYRCSDFKIPLAFA